eukprot:1336357-Prymnesium_polylepis.1
MAVPAPLLLRRVERLLADVGPHGEGPLGRRRVAVARRARRRARGRHWLEEAVERAVLARARARPIGQRRRGERAPGAQRVQQWLDQAVQRGSPACG